MSCSWPDPKNCNLLRWSSSSRKNSWSTKQSPKGTSKLSRLKKLRQETSSRNSTYLRKRSGRVNLIDATRSHNSRTIRLKKRAWCFLRLKTFKLLRTNPTSSSGLCTLRYGTKCRLCSSNWPGSSESWKSTRAGSRPTTYSGSGVGRSCQSKIWRESLTFARRTWQTDNWAPWRASYASFTPKRRWTLSSAPDSGERVTWSGFAIGSSASGPSSGRHNTRSTKPTSCMSLCCKESTRGTCKFTYRVFRSTVLWEIPRSTWNPSRTCSHTCGRSPLNTWF